MADETATTFADLELREELLGALTHLGYEEPTPIQREAIPPLIEGRDLLGQAATGTGKTAAFALPIIQRLQPMRDSRDATALVLVPTRELSMPIVSSSAPPVDSARVTLTSCSSRFGRNSWSGGWK